MDDNIIISPSERAGVPSEPQTASETDIVQEEELARPPAPTIPLRFQFGASIEPRALFHVTESGGVAGSGRKQGERLYATRQSSVRTATSTWHSPPTSTTLSSYTMADPKKQEKDFTKEVDSLLPEVQSLAKVHPKYTVYAFIVALTVFVCVGW